MALNSGTYGGGLGGPSVRGGREDRDTAAAVKRLADLRAGRKPSTILQPPVTPQDKENPFRPNPGKPKPKPKAKKKTTIEGALDKIWSVPKMQVPTLLTPDLDVTPTLQTATLNDFNVTPISIGAPPTLETAPEASPTVRMPDRQDASIRAAKLAEIAKMKQTKGSGATLLSGKAGDLRRVATRRGT